VVLLLVASAPSAQFVQPWTYRSPSGAFELSVDPSSRYGSGAAHCEMSRAGERVWAREVEFTFLDALVNDDGSAAAYACTTGPGALAASSSSHASARMEASP